MKVIDLTHTYENGQLAGNPQRHPTVEIRHMGNIERDGCNTGSMLIGTHTGTHMDAPRHFLRDGKTIDEVNLSYCVGEVTIVDFSRFGEGECVKASDVAELKVTERMLFVFGWHRYYRMGQYEKDWPYFSPEAMRSLVERGVKVIALDSNSPDCNARGRDDYVIHKRFLPQGMIFIENLANTSAIDFDKRYTLIAMPLKVKGLDGAPCRVVLIEDTAYD